MGPIPPKFGSLPDHYWQSRKDAKQRQTSLSGANGQSKASPERIFRDLMASIVYREQQETLEEKAAVSQDILRCETLLAQKIQQLGENAPRLNKLQARQFLQNVETGIANLPESVYEAPHVLVNALIYATEKFDVQD